MSGALVWLRTLTQLGAGNLARITVYRGLLRTGWYRLRLPAGAGYPGPFFHQASPRAQIPVDQAVAAAWSARAARVQEGRLTLFSFHERQVGFPPDWHRDPFSGSGAEDSALHWSAARPPHGVDLKALWEISRFDGLLALVMGALCAPAPGLLAAIERWLADWVTRNPANTGLQWRCGQETSVRLMQTLLGAELLERWGGVVPQPTLLRFVEEHCRRIIPTMLYARAQDNNHGTSEAAALYSAGLWLVAHGQPVGARLARQGRGSLMRLVERLVEPDGSFSQHSVNYHRVVLDTLWFVEYMRRRYDAPPFPEEWIGRCRAAVDWLAALVDPGNGEAPNLGNNDGARLFVLHGLPYHDYRPTVQTAAALFGLETANAPGPWDEPLAWLGLLRPPTRPAPVASRCFPDGGYVLLRAGAQARALLRVPRWRRFRPAHADPLHLDLWHGGIALSRDGGSYSYADDTVGVDYLAGAAGHSTVQFDSRDAMPRLGRFLFGAWRDCEAPDFEVESAPRTAAVYRDCWGARHRREVRLEAFGCEVEDHVGGFKERAVLRWRLAPAAWRLEGNVVRSELAEVEISASMPLRRLELVQGRESLYYLQLGDIPVLEAEAADPGSFLTTFRWRGA